MNKLFLIVGLLTAMLLSSYLASAEEAAAVADTSATVAAAEPVKEVEKDVVKQKLAPIKWYRIVGQTRGATASLKKSESLEATTKALAPKVIKPATSSAWSFAKKPFEAAKRRNAIFEEAIKRLPTQKPVKGYNKSFRGFPYKPTKLAIR